MKYSFDEIIDRTGTASLKHDGKGRYFGTTDIMPLWVADMDFRTPGFIMDAIKKRCEHEIMGYTIKSPGFYTSLKQWLQTRFNWNVNENSIHFTPGIVPALNFAVLGCTNPGDKVIVQSPVYAPFFTAVKDHNRELAINPLKLINGRYVMDLEHFESLIDERTKLFLLCSPHNPVCRVWTTEELQSVADICLKHNITILSDEIHSDLVFKHHRHIPLASISEEIGNITITSLAPSKTFNIAGLSSSAAIITNPKLSKQFLHLSNSCHLGSGNLFGLTAFEAAYTHGGEWLDELMDYLWENVVFLRKFLNEEIPQIKLIEPEGTYLMWLNFTEFGMSDPQIRDILIKKAKVGLNYGPDFGPGGEGFQRLNIGCPKIIVEEALLKIKNAFL